MKLYAIADLHLGHEFNRAALGELRPHPGDGLILCGDVGETDEHLELAFGAATRNFGAVWWCPGNHELYTTGGGAPGGPRQLRGEARYAHCVAVARRFGVRTPEDPYAVWEGEGGPALVAPLFTLYDYSFRPAHVARADALRWAEDADTVASDEFLLHPDPHPSREAWCRLLVQRAEARLADARKPRKRAALAAATAAGAEPRDDAGQPAAEGEREKEEEEEVVLPLVLANHWPLREDLVYIPRVPRFSLWCGTKATEDWHRRFGAAVVVSGHLHVPRTDWRDGTRFEECSLGYPRQWREVHERGLDINDLLREILPGPPPPPGGNTTVRWRRWG
ncbi:metallophosphoesterase-like protein [Durotheca rogersii]|uniref:metallophosphoesterase-like protein n=1 Tax=Durotheca rogersii TaxID=419775 RepID=UPI00221FB8A7|nr:metallophosphoesterase-like protein [Durotheca rogersii]KAI5858227.1 metallophosphoesterase-like protein [Durotheca rogersii]